MTAARSTVNLPPGRDPWLPLLEGAAPPRAAVTLADVCLRISCGVATGADSVFVRPADGLDPALRRFAHPTVAGRELTPGDGRSSAAFRHADTLRHELPAACRWSGSGPWVTTSCATTFAGDCSRGRVSGASRGMPFTKRRCCWTSCARRSCARTSARSRTSGWIAAVEIVPRHSVYYIVPREPAAIDVIAGYLQSPSRARVAHPELPACGQGIPAAPEPCPAATAPSR